MLIRKSLDQAGFKDVVVSQDRDKGVVTLGGTVISENDKSQAESLTRRSRNQTGSNFESWSPSQTQSEGAWILIARHIPENILPEACRIL